MHKEKYLTITFDLNTDLMNYAFKENNFDIKKKRESVKEIITKLAESLEPINVELISRSSLCFLITHNEFNGIMGLNKFLGEFNKMPISNIFTIKDVGEIDGFFRKNELTDDEFAKMISNFLGDEIKNFKA